MSKAQHTPGPWQMGFKGNGVAFVNDQTKRCICKCDTAPDESFDVAEANARLIAAAPELLEACQAVAPLLESAWRLNPGTQTQEESAALKLLVAAIAKAEAR